MRVFVNNVDGFLAGAICADLWKLGPSFVGTRKYRVDELMPPMVRRIVPRVEVRRLLKAVAACDVIIYDLHDADLEELELVLRTLHQSELPQDVTFILVSSVGVWARTQREYDEVEPEPVDEEPPAEEAAPEPAQVEPPPAAAAKAQAKAKAAPPAPPISTEPAPGEDGAEGDEDKEESEEPPPPVYRPRPLQSEDFGRRVPAPKFQEWKSIETLVLALKEKPNVSPYVVCCGIPYGNGEDALLGLFKAAWQTLPTLRVIGEGGNYLPLVHARDAARLVRTIVEQKPSLEYHLAVDKGDITQRALVEAVAAEFGVNEPVQSVTVAEAILAELADVFTMDMRMLPSPMLAPAEEAKPDVAEGDGADGIAPFRWWCERGLAENVGKVAAEFCRWRRLSPLKICITGPPGCGAAELGQRLGKRYNVPAFHFDQLIEEQRRQDSPLGKEVALAMEEIERGLVNPKAPGPTFLPPTLAAQCVEERLKSKPASFRGCILTGYPQNADDVPVFFGEDGPMPPAPEAPEEQQAEAQQEGETAAPPPEPRAPTMLVRQTAIQDAMVILSCPEEKCNARPKSTGGGMSDALFKKRMERWSKDNPLEPGPGEGLANCLTEKLGVEPLVLQADDAEEGDLARQIVECVKAKRTVRNFFQAAEAREQQPEEAPRATSPEEDEAARREAEALRLRRKEQEERLEALKKEENARLEKHSEPLRQYLTSLVVPTLTSGLIELCKEQPEDPVGYLAEYLSVYSQVAKTHGKKPRATVV